VIRSDRLAVPNLAIPRSPDRPHRQRPSATGPSTPTGHVVTMHPLAEWEQANPGTVHDPEWFGRDVLPRLASVKLSEIVEAAGLLEGVRVGHQAWKVDASCFDVAALVGGSAPREGS